LSSSIESFFTPLPAYFGVPRQFTPPLLLPLFIFQKVSNPVPDSKVAFLALHGFSFYPTLGNWFFPGFAPFLDSFPTAKEPFPFFFFFLSRL